MFDKRGTCFLKLSPPAPKTCVRDCSRAIELNPDNAIAYTFRGRANRLLGNFTEAAMDLSSACKIDFDEQADEWLKEVTTNAKTLAEHHRMKERKAAKKELKERQNRVKKAKEAREKAAKEQQDQPEPDTGGMGGLGGSLVWEKECLEWEECLAAFLAWEGPGGMGEGGGGWSRLWRSYYTTCWSS